jgi:high affinity Mn2+ porin
VPGKIALLVALSAQGFSLTMTLPVQAAEPSGQMPTKAPADWSGFYVGAHLGEAWGRSHVTAWDAGAGTSAIGTLNVHSFYDAFGGTGSYFSGLHAGYNKLFNSRFLIGVEADVTFPNTVGGSLTFSSASNGQARYEEFVQFSGTVRSRIGYAQGGWLLYATAGLAWSFDQFSRTQLAGVPVSGTAVPGTVETRFMVPRIGWAAGAGIEVALTSHWNARIEYLATGFGNRSVSFPAGAQTFNSDLALQSIRLGLNYRIGQSSDFFVKGPDALEMDRFAFHAQTTYVHQYAFPFRSPYRGQNSLVPNQGRETWDVTGYVGARLWQGAEFWINPEIDQGFGLSGTLGAAGFTSGEAYKVGASVPYTRLPRMFVRQTIDLGGDTQKVEAGINQFAGSQTANRIVLTVGKFSVADIFDTNKYVHDPRADFMNWSLIDTGTFDYASDAWGFTYGAAAEWYQGAWTLRFGLFDLSVVPNSTILDSSFKQFQSIVELEHRHEIAGQPGKIAVTGFLTRGRMGRFDDAVRLSELTGEPANTALVRRYQSRSGVSFNLEQQVTADLGVFARAGIAGGAIEPYEFTDIDRTVAAGLSLAGKQWGRPDDTLGIAGVVNGISDAHKAYFNAAGLGILVGDGRLPNPGPEKIAEIYYSFPIANWRATLDYQFIANPGYNRDRGPASVIGTRLRAQF